MSDIDPRGGPMNSWAVDRFTDWLDRLYKTSEHMAKTLNGAFNKSCPICGKPLEQTCSCFLDNFKEHVTPNVDVVKSFFLDEFEETLDRALKTALKMHKKTLHKRSREAGVESGKKSGYRTGHKDGVRHTLQVCREIATDHECSDHEECDCSYEVFKQIQDLLEKQR